MKKRFVSLTLAASLAAVSLAGCGSSDADATTAAATTAADTTAAEKTEEAETTAQAAESGENTAKVPQRWRRASLPTESESILPRGISGLRRPMVTYTLPSWRAVKAGNT